MAEALPLSEGELQLLGSLVRHRVRFMIVGLSAAALQGAPVVTQDVDLWFEDLNAANLLKALREVGAGYVPPFGPNPPMLAGQHTDLFDVVLAMSGLGPFDQEVRHARKVRLAGIEVKVLPLNRILASKIAANRPKDRLVIPTLRNAMRALEAKPIRKSQTSRARENAATKVTRRETKSQRRESV